MCILGLGSIKRCHLTSIGNPIVEIRRSYDRLISAMGFPILIRRYLYIESGPWLLHVHSREWVIILPWWRHQMETFSALLAICAGNSPVSGEFPAQRPVAGSYDIFFDLCLNKRLCKQSWCWWFETLLWRQCNVKCMSASVLSFAGKLSNPMRKIVLSTINKVVPHQYVMYCCHTRHVHRTLLIQMGAELGDILLVYLYHDHRHIDHRTTHWLRRNYSKTNNIYGNFVI